MFYCPKCLNIYNITKSIKTSEQLGGSKLDDIIEKILSNEDIEDDKIKLDEDDLIQLNKMESFKKLQNKQKDYVFNYLNDMIQKKKITNKDTKIVKKMYFICKSCGNNEPIKEGSMIISRQTNKEVTNETGFNAKEYLEMKIYPRTRQYSCLNDKCESHKKSEKKSAMFMRINGTYKIRYICEACETSWIAS
jgi:hypothetical protein